MIKLLIVDDEIRIREMIRKYAQFEGFHCDEAKSGTEAVKMALENEYDCIIMDIMMPEMDGFAACRQIRKEKNVPILMLSALSEEYDKIHGFDLGVDDYVVKPFSPKELMMRIRAIVKRSKGQENEFFEVEGLKIDFSAHQVLIDGEAASLSPKEYDLLCALVSNRGIAMTREKLLQKVWGYDFFGDDRTLDTHIKLLRRNLKHYSKFIVTLRGVGYRFEKTV
ncbi:MAG: response regulator transcription factor [Erysipelotrichaceae bacterium]|nr:response regulator transcription factor [Erysipelotrichaceae bacterium]